MFRLHHSTGVTCATVLLFLGLLSTSEARSGEPSAKPAASAARSEQSIHRALTEGAPAQAKRLLEQGANIEARNAEGATPLITASGRGDLALVTLLLHQQARVDATDRSGNTALHEASFYGWPQCVEALLAAGAQTSTRNALAFTPLHQAVRRFWEMSGESRTERLARQANVIDVLLHHGADPDQRDTSGRTPIVLAVESSNGWLRQAFARPLAQTTVTAETPMTTRSPEATSDASQEVPLTPGLAQEAASSDIPTDRPTSSPQIDGSQTGPSFTPPSDISGNEDIRAETHLTPAPPTESSAAPTAAESLPPAVTDLPDATPLPQLTPPISAPIPAPPTTAASPLTATPPQPLLAQPPPPATAMEQAPTQAPETPPASQTPATPDMARPDVHHTSPTKPNIQALASEPLSPNQPIHPEVVPSTSSTPMPTPPIAAIDPQAATKPAPPPSSSDEPRRSVTPMNASAEEIRKPRQPTLFLPSTESTPPHASPSLASTNASVPASSTPQTSTTGPSADTPPEPPKAPVPDRTEVPTATDDRRPWIVQSLGFGLGLGWTHNLGPRRVDSVTVVNRIVRIDNERNDLVRFMPEMHLWIDRWDEQRWSWGPFLTVAPGSRIIDAVGFGIMMGYRPHQRDQYSFNLGIGGTLDLDARVLGDGLIANEPLPPRENTARTKHTTAAGLLVLFSIGWDLSAPHRPAQIDRQ
ncbi:MAG: ankyrin repeat domain-containing protein [Nitrospira sp.]|nr:ankyrin repeat domain-containing protein [Nitrospira sp.]